MNCKQVEKYLWDLAENKLDKNLKIQIDEHLKTCSSCKRKYDLILMANTLIDKEKQEKPNYFLETKILNKIELLNQKQQRLEVFLGKFEFALTVIIIVIAITLGVILGNYYTKQTFNQSYNTNYYAYSDDIFYENEDFYFIDN